MFFMRRPAHGNQLLAQHAGRAARRRKNRLLLIAGPGREISCWRSMRAARQEGGKTASC